MLLFVGTPNLSARCNRLNNKLESIGLNQNEKDQVLSIFRSCLEMKWNEYRFLTFAENESLLNRIVQLVVINNRFYSYFFLIILFCLFVFYLESEEIFIRRNNK
jgi:hypothetical protein